MDYRQAADIARRNPGAVLTRDDSGSFVVRCDDGTLIGFPSDGNSGPDTVGHDRERHLEEIARLRRDFAEREGQLRLEIAELQATVQDLTATAAESHMEARRLGEIVAKHDAENTKLRALLAKVPAAEWDRINEFERRQREEVAAQKKAERNFVKCKCLGEVENCDWCYGAGHYSVDGYGNRV